MEDDKIIALAKFLEVEYDDIIENIDTYSYGNKEYLVLNYDESEEKYEEYLDSCIEEIVLPEIPKYYHIYFDEESWKRDSRINGDKASALASYDGNEYEVDGYLIYRIN